MISWHDLYVVLTAVIPLYVAMILAYGSVRWWKIFTSDQCSGINRFVAIFAVPLLSFHFISKNDIYAMNFRFIAADSLQKVITLVVLALWANLSRNGGLEWSITVFSLSTLPNTLVMGIPLLIAMYGEDSGSLMVQVVVLQCIVWYTLLLFLFEYRGAKVLIMEQFPQTAASIVSFKVESDVASLDGQYCLEADAEVGPDGKLHVVVRRLNASRRSFATPRPSNFTGAEIYSLSSSRNPTPRGSNFNHSDSFCSLVRFPAGRLSNFGNSDGGQLSNFEENGAQGTSTGSSKLGFCPNGFNISCSHKNAYNNSVNGNNDASNNKVNNDVKELHMFVWSSTASPMSEMGGDRNGSDVFGGSGFNPSDQTGRFDYSAKEIRLLVGDNESNKGASEEKEKEGLSSTAAKLEPTAGSTMPPASVMTRLIFVMVWRKLIRNPNTYSSLIGLIWSLVSFRWGVHMPQIVEKSIAILSDAGLGMAMFSLGLFMALQPKIIACGNTAATFAMAVRFLMGPAVMAVASIAIGLRGTLLHIAIVQAALPQGIVPFVFAKEYNVHPAILSTAVIFGMLIALPITLVYYILLGL